MNGLKEIIIRFRNYYVYLTQYSGANYRQRNNIQCMYVANDDYITELQNKQNRIKNYILVQG